MKSNDLSQPETLLLKPELVTAQGQWDLQLVEPCSITEPLTCVMNTTFVVSVEQPRKSSDQAKL